MPAATLSLAFAIRNGNTRVTVSRQDPPWRVVRAFPNQAGEALVHLHNVSGGILGGDDLRLQVNVEAGAQAQLTTVSATRIYRMQQGSPEAQRERLLATTQHPNSTDLGVANSIPRPFCARPSLATQANCITIYENGLLEYLPDPVIPFAASCFKQTTSIHLAEGAGFIGWETLSAGRIARGERFAFDEFTSETSIYSRNRPIALERFSVCPTLRPPASFSRIGPFSYTATMYVCRAGHDAAQWATLERKLGEQTERMSDPHTRWGVSALVRDGIVIRALGQQAHAIAAGLRALWKAAKEDVWGTPALAPRKVY